MGTLSCAVPLYLHRMVWTGRDHAKLPGDTILLHQGFQWHYRFNSIQARYTSLRCFRRKSWRNRRPIEDWVLTCPLDVPISIHYTTLVQWFQKTWFFVMLSFLDGLNSAAGSVLIRFYEELNVWISSKKKPTDVKPKSTNISLLIVLSLKVKLFLCLTKHHAKKTNL
jgi:hypothetical protein